MSMIEKHVEPDADAARQLMGNKYRDMRSASGRNLRDFIIMRDYINLLEYIQQVLHHFQNRSSWIDGPTTRMWLSSLKSRKNAKCVCPATNRYLLTIVNYSILIIRKQNKLIIHKKKSRGHRVLHQSNALSVVGPLSPFIVNVGETSDCDIIQIWLVQDYPKIPI